MTDSDDTTKADDYRKLNRMYLDRQAEVQAWLIDELKSLGREQPILPEDEPLIREYEMRRYDNEVWFARACEDGKLSDPDLAELGNLINRVSSKIDEQSDKLEGKAE